MTRITDIPFTQKRKNQLLLRKKEITKIDGLEDFTKIISLDLRVI